MHMRTRLACPDRALFFVAGLVAAVAAVPALHAQADPATDPVAMVGRAEALLGKGEQEQAVLLLWQALEVVADGADSAIGQATAASALTLLQRCDPLDAERRRAFTAVAEQQVAIAKAYRIKKWFRTADERLDVAAQFDVSATTKERAAVAAKLKQAPPPAAKPKPDAAEDAELRLLRRAGAEYASGSWQELEDGLEVPRQTAPHSELLEWVCKQDHADHEVLVEIRAMAPKERWNAAIGLGLGFLPGSRNYSGLRCAFEAVPGSGMYLSIWRIRGMQADLVAEQWMEVKPPADGRFGLSARVDGAKVTAYVDGRRGPSFTADAPVRGRVGLLHGVQDVSSCPVQFRRLRVAPLPADQPSDEELRQREQLRHQNEITAATERARELLAAKDQEAAARELRQAQHAIDALTPGVLRDNLAKTVLGMLNGADSIARKRDEAAKACGAALGALAERYRETGRARCALVIARQGTRFDPDGQAATVAAMQQAIVDWNLAQAAARAAELQPPVDDGAVLREWFEGGRLLDSRGRPWQVAGAVARVPELADGLTAWSPKPGKLLLAGTASVHVRLPAPDTLGGLCFDVAGPHDFCVAMLRRDADGLTLIVSRWASGTWRYLAGKTIPLDAWRLDAWHELTVTASPAGMRVRAPAYETEIVLQRLQLGQASGQLALVASNDTKTPADLELRAFRVKTD